MSNQTKQPTERSVTQREPRPVVPALDTLPEQESGDETRPEQLERVRGGAAASLSLNFTKVE